MNTEERKPEGKDAESFEDFMAKEEELWRPAYEKVLGDCRSGYR